IREKRTLPIPICTNQRRELKGYSQTLTPALNATAFGFVSTPLTGAPPCHPPTHHHAPLHRRAIKFCVDLQQPPTLVILLLFCVGKTLCFPSLPSIFATVNRTGPPLPYLPPFLGFTLH
ncbi:hypothetical protein U1Q18_017928, partial [Sarracenia purpurea var. burkii]